jgi:hypothetical protein
MNLTRDAEMLEDLKTTQQIIPWVRWFLLAAAMFVTNYRVGDLDNTQLAVNNVAIWGLSLYNAFLHSRAYIGRPLGVYPVLLASVLDIVVITALLGISDNPFMNNYFVFYYAAVFGFGMVFPPVWTLGYTLLTAAAYSLLSIVAGEGIFVSQVIADGIEVHSGTDEKVLITRLVVMFAIAAGASIFWRLERARRAESVQAQLDILQAGLSGESGPPAPQQSTDE